MQYLKLSIESHDRQIGELTDRLAEQTENIAALGAKIEAQGANIDKLVVVAHDLLSLAKNHEQRLDNGGL
jgi:hypothetical protein